MTIEIEASPENLALADAVLSRIGADAKIIKAKAFFWKATGGALVALAVGGGVDLAYRGYAATVEKQAIAQEQATEFFLAALSRATLTVKLADGSEIAIAKGATIGVSPDAVLHLDPNAVVRVAGQVPTDAAPRPMPEHVRSAAVTNYGLYHKVPFGAGGEVNTVWFYDDSEQRSPSNEICWYVERQDSQPSAAVVIGEDGRMTLPKSPSAGVDLAELRAAFASCIWAASAKAAPAPAHTNLIHAKT